MSLLQRNYPHVKIELPTDFVIIGNAVTAYGFAMPVDGVASISVKVLAGALPPINGMCFAGAFPFDWYAIVAGLPFNQPLRLEIEAVDTYGNTGKDAHYLICLPATEEAAAPKHPARPTGPGVPLVPPVIYIAYPPTSPNPYPVPTPGPFTTTGSITDSSLVPSMSATIKDANGNLIANGVPNGGGGMGGGQMGTWSFYFYFNQPLKGPGTLSVSAPGAISCTRSLTFG